MNIKTWKSFIPTSRVMQKTAIPDWRNARKLKIPTRETSNYAFELLVFE